MTDYPLPSRQATATERQRFTARLLDIALIAVFLLPVLIYAYGGTFARYIADDYCTVYAAQEYGVLGSVGYWYNNWAGQVVNWFIKGIGGQIGLPFTRVFPAVVMALIFAALV